VARRSPHTRRNESLQDGYQDNAIEENV